jgi:prefoldin subunit 5
MHFLKDKGETLMTIAADTQAQLDRLSKVASEVDNYVAAQVKAATDVIKSDHDQEVAALTAQIDALTTKLGVVA